ncbi:MAG TPA: sulfotransferase [Pirellulaceae bacterium]|jgi:hypothetical protein|nr:sulfotransferase [Pirellulaceae bacterium]
MRHPLDVCLSCYYKNFITQTGLSYTFDLRNLGLYHRQYVRLMDHWRQVLPLRMLDVDYESLVDNQEEISRTLVEFCGLEWNPECLEFHKTEHDVRTASVGQVRQPIYSTSVGRAHHNSAGGVAVGIPHQDSEGDRVETGAVTPPSGVSFGRTANNPTREERLNSVNYLRLHDSCSMV